MECDVCRDKLADFLLDELPESEAVLVQEHLALCQTCQATYKELKGTGRALEAVPAMRPVRPTTNFSSQVMRAAREESEKILRDMPTERRIRLQQRRQNRPRRQASATATQPKASPWRGALLLMLAGAIALTAILLYYRRGGPAETVTLGALQASTGRVEQFRPQGGTQWSTVTSDQSLRSGDEFLCDAEGRARFELTGGGSVLLGPRAHLRILSSSAERVPEVRLVKGELGIERGRPEPNLADWMVECGPWRLRVTGETKVYLSVNPDMPSAPAVVTVLKGIGHIGLPGRPDEIMVAAGQLATLSGDLPDIRKGGALPAWRTDLCNVQELSSMLNGMAKVVDRTEKGLLVELSYGYGRTSLGADWLPEKDRAPWSADGGVLHVPNGSRCSLNVSLAAPLQIEAGVSASVPKECPWGLAFQQGEHGRVSVDFGTEAVLTVSAKPVPRVARLGYRTVAQTAERIRIELSATEEGEVVLSTAAGKTQPLPVPKKLLEPGTLQIESLGEGLILEGLRVQGVLPREWILKHLTEAK